MARSMIGRCPGKSLLQYPPMHYRGQKFRCIWNRQNKAYRQQV